MRLFILIVVGCVVTGMTGCFGTKKQDLCVEGGKANSYWASSSFPQIEGAEFCRELVERTDRDFVQFAVYNGEGSYSVDYLKPLEDELKKKGWTIEKISTDPKLDTVQMHANDPYYGRMFIGISPCSKKGFSYMKCTMINFSKDP